MNGDKFEANSNPLGKRTEYSVSYQPSLLFAIARQGKRQALGIKNKPVPFDKKNWCGEDIWNAYEISWLNLSGLPQVAIGEFRFPSTTPNMVESKSLKLYLNAFNQTSFSSLTKVESTIQRDLSKLAGSPVSVVLKSLKQTGCSIIKKLDADNLDDLKVTIDQYSYDAALLRVEVKPDGANVIVEESLCSHLLKSNCLITNQPDWASILIQYKGHKISHPSILKYLVSFRTHNEFHEQCVERIFCDLMEKCKPQQLTVYARYTRRGGLDINPWRSNCVKNMENIRLLRQ